MVYISLQHLSCVQSNKNNIWTIFINENSNIYSPRFYDTPLIYGDIKYQQTQYSNERQVLIPCQWLAVLWYFKDWNNPVWTLLKSVDISYMKKVI